MTFVDRVRNICMSPASEWPVIAQEDTPAAALVTKYLAPLAAASALAGFIGSSIAGLLLPLPVPIVAGLVAACVSFVLTIVGVFVIALTINALAPTFRARQDARQALKLAVYSCTPALVGGLFRVVPFMGVLLATAAWVFSLYLLYVGLQPLMKAPADKLPAYTIVILICSVVVGMITSVIVGGLVSIGVVGQSRL